MATAARQIIAFDFGLRQIGVATGSEASQISSELSILQAKEGIPDWQAVATLFAEWQPDICIVGLPLNMDGSESALSQRARKFANRLNGRFGMEAILVDERLTSVEAKHIAREQGRSSDYKKSPVDALAAKLLIDQWFQQQTN